MVEDPGIAVVRERLAVDGVVSEQCEQAIARWYVNTREQRTVEVRQEANDLVATLIQEGTPATGGRREVFTNNSIEWAGGVDILTESIVARLKRGPYQSVKQMVGSPSKRL